MRESAATPLNATEAVALLGSAVAGVARSAQRLRWRTNDLDTVVHDLDKSCVKTVDEYLDLAGEAEVTLQVIDRLYQHLSDLYFRAVGQNE
jgi:hypothetical protein